MREKNLPNYSEIIEALDAELNPVCSCDWKKFRSCSAKVVETPRFIVLRSYRTIVAIVDKTTGTCYDFLRAVYGYTATSAQHIAKFRHDFACSGKYIRIDDYAQLVKA